MAVPQQNERHDDVGNAQANQAKAEILKPARPKYTLLDQAQDGIGPNPLAHDGPRHPGPPPRWIKRWRCQFVDTRLAPGHLVLTLFGWHGLTRPRNLLDVSTSRARALFAEHIPRDEQRLTTSSTTEFEDHGHSSSEIFRPEVENLVDAICPWIIPVASWNVIRRNKLQLPCAVDLAFC